MNFATILTLLLFNNLFATKNCTCPKPLPNIELNKNHYFDHIVVGSGPTGSMVAISLAENGFNSLLIEAGQDYTSPNLTTPAFHVRASEDSNIAWDYYVKHYDEYTGIRQDVLYPRVGGVGGCTLHNAMIHILPNSEDYERMVKATGLESWSEKNMRHYYEKIVKPKFFESIPGVNVANQLGTGFQAITTQASDIMAPSKSIVSGREDKGGWLKLSTVNIFNLLSKDQKLIDLVNYILKGAVISNILGFDINSYSSPASDKLAVDSERDFLVPINNDVTKGNQRVGIAERLHEVKQTLPLTIWTNTLATKILMNKNKVAYGIQYQQGKYLYKAGKRVNKRDGQYGTVYAKREIIISAGTFNTPQLMMLSGIGDQKHLREKGIKPIVNNPNVGRNLHDRYEVSVNFKMESKFSVLDGCLFKGDNSDPCYKQFNDSATGPYTFNGVLTGSTIKSKPSLSVPDLFMLTAPIDFWGYHNGMGDEVLENKDIFSILLLKAHTNNRKGYVKLNTKNPRDVPDINFRYFAEGENEDMPPIIKGIRDARNTMKNFGTKYTEINPGSDVESDEDLAKFIKNSAWGHHATGTMRMGKFGDNKAVLDGDFNVLGTKNLRVADMSIFGDIPGYFPVLYLYMVGAKATDAIIADAI